MNYFVNVDFCLEYIDEWFTLRSSIRKVNRGKIHLKIEYKQLQI